MLSAHVQHIVFARHFSYCIYAQKAVPLQAFSLRGTFHPSRLFYPFRPFPSPVLFLPVVWQVFRLLSRPRGFSHRASPLCPDLADFPASIPPLCSDLGDFPPSHYLCYHIHCHKPIAFRTMWYLSYLRFCFPHNFLAL